MSTIDRIVVHPRVSRRRHRTTTVGRGADGRRRGLDGLQLAVLYTPLNRYFGTVPLDAGD